MYLQSSRSLTSLSLRRYQLIVLTNVEKKILEWLAEKGMILQSNRVFIDEAESNMHIHRNFGRSDCGTSAKIDFLQKKAL
jgi:DNA-binding CsgD family transcriptional regulator